MITLTTKERARGQWRAILPALGLDENFLTGRNGPCPVCGTTKKAKTGGGFIAAHGSSLYTIRVVLRVELASSNGCGVIPKGWMRCHTHKPVLWDAVSYPNPPPEWDAVSYPPYKYRT